MDNDNDDVPTLSAETLSALRQFLFERQALELYEQKLSSTITDEPDNFEENWNLSQFWYSDETADLLAQEAIEQSNGPIACVSTPSVFRGLKRAKATQTCYLLEYDTRFRCYGQQFVFYDYNKPLDIPEELHHKITFIAVDPPFLSEDCFSKGKTMESFVQQHFKVQPCEFVPKHKRQLRNEFGAWTNYQSSRLKTLPSRNLV